MRTIVHIDMDAFFASVEALLHPEYQGLPLVVGGDPTSRRGVVATCSYEARAYGIRSAMPIREAVRRCPQAIFVRPNMKEYARFSKQIMEVLDSLSPVVEPISIDEAFMDMTGCEHFYNGAQQMGGVIKERVKVATGLSASIGIGPNKYIAKLASDMQKPNGLLVVDPGDVRKFLDPLPVDQLWGAGPKTAQALREVGVFTVRDLLERTPGWIERLLGERAASHLFQLARGIDDRPVEPTGQIKSMSRETTFDNDISDAELLRHVLAGLVADLGVRLRRAGLWAGNVFVKVRHPDFSTHTRQRVLTAPVQDDDRLFAEADAILEELIAGRPLRLLGVGVNQFDLVQQVSLFDDDERHDRISRTMDKINSKFGRRVLRHGREWMPDGPEGKR